MASPCLMKGFPHTFVNIQQPAMWDHLSSEIRQHSIRALARGISLVENEVEGYESLLTQTTEKQTPVVGITGPPGAGKSTLTDALIGEWINKGLKVAVLCVDPSSPFNMGAVLGDRIRMNQWYTHPNVFIRSLATRGSLGGLHPHIIEIVSLVGAAGFDRIIVETVGVGQSEIEVAGLADICVVVLVPEAGDEIQTMKAGLMEIADLFVVNKADRPEAREFLNYLKLMLAPAFSKHQHEIPILSTVASSGEGIPTLAEKIDTLLGDEKRNSRKQWLLAERAYYLISRNRMKDLTKEKLLKEIGEASANGAFNLYAFVRERSQN